MSDGSSSGTGGWIRVPRGFFADDAEELNSGEEVCRALAFLDLVALARWHDGDDLRRGQLRASQRALGERWGWSRGRVRRFLDDLEEAGRIRRETPEKLESGASPAHPSGPPSRPTSPAHLPDAVTICDYGTYQGGGEEERPTSPAHPSGPPERPTGGGSRPTSPAHPSGPPPDSENVPESQDEPGGGVSGAAHPSGPPSRPILKKYSSPPSGTDVPSVGAATNGADGYGDLEALRDLWEEAEGQARPARLSHLLTGYWIKRFEKYSDGQRPAPDEIKKHAKTFRRVCEKHPARVVFAAALGIEQVAPHVMGEPWDAMDYERKLTKAQGQWREHPIVKELETDRELDRALDEAGADA